MILILCSSLGDIDYRKQMRTELLIKDNLLQEALQNRDTLIQEMKEQNLMHHPKSSISLAKQIPMIDTMIFNEMDGTWDSDDYIDEAPFYITDN